MRSWLTYIFLLMVACGTVLTSCSDVLSEEGLGTCDDRTTVRLTISFGGDDDPMSRDVGSNPAPKDDDLDYTTEAQAKIVDGDIFALVVNEDNTLVEYIDDLHIVGTVAQDQNNYYTWTLEGTMRPTTGNNKVKIVLLANLKENGITNPHGYFVNLEEGKDLTTDVYTSLIYSYNGSTWSLSNNRIPMWGETAATTVPASSNPELACYLYRAMAKVQIWVDKKNGLPGEDGKLGTDDDFTITKITVKNANNQGYCVHVADNQPTTNTQYTQPKVPTSVQVQEDIVYNVDDKDSNDDTFNDARQAFSDMIYLPEQVNLDANGKELLNAVTIEVTYNYNGENGKVGTIHFTEDIIRNHSYIFNINVSNDATPTLYYQVIDWTTVDNGTLNFGNATGDVTQ